ncbi:xanthine dehydrogenase/oxidase-like isoform X2 [Littorina saxatilis]|uniref:xanthine dehydrogenase n=1 Tax=Littorina saxatilis TaxID=31220 RepID=A0AAN9BFG5_9CAEN
MAATKLVFFVNGRKSEVPCPDPEMTLLQYIRRNLKLTGTKLGCAEGGCGACTVMLSRYDPSEDRIHHYSVNACLAPLCSMHGLAVTTVEGIGSLSTRLHPVQEKLASAHGSQCGFCTPGFVMSMYTLLRNHPEPTLQHLETAFDGNLCRCTGYRAIIDGYRPFTKGCCSKGENCCMNGAANRNENLSDGLRRNAENCVDMPDGKAVYDPTQEPIFPPYLKTEGKQLHYQSLQFRTDRVTWYRPTSLTELLDIKKRHPACKFVIGNTEIGIEIKFKGQLYPALVAATHVPELLTVEHTDSGIRFGSSVTLATLETVLKKAVDDLPEFKTRVFSAVVEMLQWFAGYQIRNVAALGGNIMTASPISDLNPLLLACGATVQVISTDGTVRELIMDSSFFTGYRKTAVKPHEILLSVFIPFTRPNEYFYGFKQANRKEDDISIVNAGIRVVMGNYVTVQDIALAFGGMAPMTVMATQTRNALVGQKWNEELLSKACETLAKDLPLSEEAPGGMIQYRRSLTVSFFFKAYLDILRRLHAQNLAPDIPLQSSYLSATQPMERDLPRGTQVYESVTPDQPAEDALHRPLVHQSAYKQTSGEAVYVDDMPLVEGEVYMGCVLSIKAHARLVRVDPSQALAMEGVLDYISHLDVPGSNIWGSGEEVFASKEVTYQGQPIGVVLAESQALARRAAAAVVVEYEPLDTIISIKEAINKDSYFAPLHAIARGDITSGFAASDHVVEGEIHIEAQEHFYMETNATICRPGEDGEMEIFASTQNPTQAQVTVAKALDVPQHKILVRVKRLGGGFGGKETRSAALIIPSAVAARKTKRAVRCMLDRDEDMIISGTRHPFLGRYRVGFTSEGKILALELDLYANVGSSLDLSIGVMDRALFHADNCYNIPNVTTKGWLCKTNIPPTTAFRGFGGPQSMIVAEAWIAHVASCLNMAPEKLREINFYKEGDLTHFNQKLEQVTLQRCWQECTEMSNFDLRRQKVDQFNSENRWRKRGLAILPTKFGLSFTKLDMNQGGALVHIYTDGSVLVSHGGVEMGQGLHTKMIQIASRVLAVAPSRVLISENSTNTVPNTTPTAASMSSDIYGQAVKEACETLRERLDKHQKACGDVVASWEELVKSAYLARVNLSASGFFIVPDLGYDFATNSGNPFAYFTYGVACSEVEVDCLTGDHRVMQTDIVMDVGKSLNPTIDVGQIEGGFVQGYGMMMLEQYKVRPDGTLLTRGPGTYKIPSLGNVPAVFNVSLLRHSNNPKAVYSSKGIGEPPLFLAASVLHAVQDAVTSARNDAGLQTYVTLDTPATPDRIRLACADDFTKQFDPPTKNKPVKPWYVDL